MKIGIIDDHRVPNNNLIMGLVIDGVYLVLGDNHHNRTVHHIFAEFEVANPMKGTLEERFLRYGPDRAKPVYKGDILVIQL